jgi:hypothetical protein
MIFIFILLLLLLYFLYLNICIEKFIIDDNLTITLYDNVNDNNMGGYNIGDLLNMPSFWAGWNNNPHNNDKYYKAYVTATEQFPNSIIYYYSLLRKDSDEPIPNLHKLEIAVDEYINNNNLNDVLNKVDDNNILYVHLRSGDKGVVEDNYINNINKLAENYEKIIILTGIHSDERFNSIDNSKKYLIESLKKINNNKIEVNLDKPDNHIAIMRKCKNLLVHKGGFSIIGSIIFTGNNLYITDLFECKDNNIIIDHLKNKNINYHFI